MAPFPSPPSDELVEDGDAGDEDIGETLDVDVTTIFSRLH
jgi:hypothetical protein